MYEHIKKEMENIKNTHTHTENIKKKKKTQMENLDLKVTINELGGGGEST